MERNNKLILDLRDEMRLYIFFMLVRREIFVLMKMIFVLGLRVCSFLMKGRVCDWEGFWLRR